MTSPTTEGDGAAQFAFWLRFWRWAVAAEQVLGGLFGVYGVAFGPLAGSSRVVLLLACAAFVAAAWGGVLLALGRRGGVTVSLAVQAIQLVQVATGSVVYSFCCGLQLIAVYLPPPAGPDLGLQGFLGSRFVAWFSPSGAALWHPPSGVNLVAALAILCLLYVRASERGPSTSSGVGGPGRQSPEAEGVWPPAPEP